MPYTCTCKDPWSSSQLKGAMQCPRTSMQFLNANTIHCRCNASCTFFAHSPLIVHELHHKVGNAWSTIVNIITLSSQLHMNCIHLCLCNTTSYSWERACLFDPLSICPTYQFSCVQLISTWSGIAQYRIAIAGASDIWTLTSHKVRWISQQQSTSVTSWKVSEVPWVL